jgi:hypothetical protein
MVIVDKNTVRLCRAGSCCPVVEKNDENSFTISDDYNGKVKMTKDELRMLKEAIEHFEK